MTNQQPTQSQTQQLGSPIQSQSANTSTTTFHPTTARTSTSSLTLVETASQRVFSPPPRTGTDSSTSTTSSQDTVTSRNSSTSERRNNNNTNLSQAAIARAREVDRAHRNVKMSARQAELLRYKGTYTDSGRHSDDWLFGGWSFTGTVKGAWKWAHGNGNGNGGERRE